MPRGGHNAKPVVLHLQQGTYRKGRHEQGRQAWERMHGSVNPVDWRCDVCGTTEGPFGATYDEETGEIDGVGCICPGCIAGGVIAFGAEVLDLVPREQLVDYLNAAGEVDEKQ